MLSQFVLSWTMHISDSLLTVAVEFLLVTMSIWFILEDIHVENVKIRWLFSPFSPIIIMNLYMFIFYFGCGVWVGFMFMGRY